MARRNCSRGKARIFARAWHVRTLPTNCRDSLPRSTKILQPTHNRVALAPLSGSSSNTPPCPNDRRQTQACGIAPWKFQARSPIVMRFHNPAIYEQVRNVQDGLTTQANKTVRPPFARRTFLPRLPLGILRTRHDRHMKKFRDHRERFAGSTIFHGTHGARIS